MRVSAPLVVGVLQRGPNLSRELVTHDGSRKVTGETLGVRTQTDTGGRGE